jgi:hypothetical protein
MTTVTLKPLIKGTALSVPVFEGRNLPSLANLPQSAILALDWLIVAARRAGMAHRPPAAPHDSAGSTFVPLVNGGLRVEEPGEPERREHLR